MAAHDHKPSRVQFAFQPGGPYPNHCGYCHGPEDSFVADGILAEDMTVQDFLALVDRGCQRSGKFVYLPCNKITCCPQYVMRLDTSTYRISKQQKRAVRRFKEYLKTGYVSGMPDLDNPVTKSADKEGAELEKGEETDGTSFDKPLEPPIIPESSQPKKKVKQGSGPNPDLPTCRKAKVIRQERKAKKIQQTNQSPGQGKPDGNNTVKMTSPSPIAMETQSLPQKQATDMSSEIALSQQDDWKHKFTVKLVNVNPKSIEYQTTFKQSYEVFCKFQMTIHKEPEDKCQEDQFVQFCVDSPLIPEPSNIPGIEYGSYHQQYWIDDTLIMVGVLDFLPQGVLCNYLYYDPYYRFLAPGVFSALYEIGQTQGYSKSDSLMRYYYMGYYVHDCPKMNYKRFYDSSYLLCPITLEYVPLELCRMKLDKHKYCQLSDTVKTETVSSKKSQDTPNEEVEDNGEVIDEDLLGSVLVFNHVDNQTMSYREFVAIRGNHFDNLVEKYVDTVGMELACRMVLYGLVRYFM